MTGDEEKPGSPHETTRAALLDAAKRSDIALAFEGYAPGTAVTGRRGIADWRLEVTAPQGHSGTIFGEARGSGAIYEASRILTAFHDELREPYLTYNPGIFLGGTDVSLPEGTSAGTATGKHNVVARSAIVEGDLRFLSAEQLERAEAKMRAIVAKNLPKTSASIVFDTNMPSMAPTDGNRALLRTLDAEAATSGQARWSSTIRRSAAPATSPSSRTWSTLSTASAPTATATTLPASTPISPSFPTSPNEPRCWSTG